MSCSKQYGGLLIGREALRAAEKKLSDTIASRLERQYYLQSSKSLYKNGARTAFDTLKIVEARKRQNDRLREYQPATEELKETLAVTMLEKARALCTVQNDQTAYFVIGPPAAGKSSLLTDRICKDEGALLIDSDAVKPHLDGYTTGTYAGMVHSDLSDIADIMVFSAIDEGCKMVLPLVGRSLSHLRDLRDILLAANYTIHLRLVNLLPEEAARRSIARYYKTDRFVDPAYVLYEVHTKPRYHYGILKHEGGFSTYEAYTTDGPKGQEPRRID